MSRITQRKLDDLAHGGALLTQGVDRLQRKIDSMIANPRAKYGRTVTLLASARTHLVDCRAALARIDRLLAADRPRNTGDEWDTVEDVARELLTAATCADAAANVLRGAAGTLTGR